MVSIETYKDNCKTDWNNFVDSSKNSTFLFNRDFMEYHSDRFEDFSLMVYKNSELVAVLPLNIINNKVYSHQGLTYGGLIVKNDIKFEIFFKLFTQILKYLNKKSVDKLFIKQIPLIYNSNFNGELDYLSFMSGGNIYRRDIISVIDMRNDFKISKDRIQGYKRGVKNNLEIREVDNFDEFWNYILIPTLSKRHSVKPVHTLDEIKQLGSNFSNNIKQFNVYYKSQIVAGTTIFQTPDVVHIQYIGSTPEKNFLGSLDFLFYKLIKEVYVNHKYFDFGNSHENGGKQINQGLIYWKEGFGARSLTHDFYEIETSNFKKLDTILV